MADLGPHEPDSCSSSLVLYEEDINPEEDQSQLMETENLTPAEAPVKEEMGITAAPENYQPATPRYIRADEDGQDTDEEGDTKATYLAPTQTPAPKPSQDGPLVQALLKEKNLSAEDPQGSSGEESMPELIDLGKGEETPTPSQPKRADHPNMLKLPGKMVITSEKLPAFSFPPLQDHIKTLPAAAPEICPEVPEEQIIYIDDDVDPTPLQLLESQVDSLLMPPPSDTTAVAQKALQSPGRDQLSRMPERRKHSPSDTRKKTLQERQNAKSLKLKVGPVAKMHTGPVDTHRTQKLVKLTSAVVPLQRLKIQDDSLPEAQKNKPEAEVPAPPQK